MSHLHTECFHGEAIGPILDALAALRIQVFAEWPYLYAGTAEYEKSYLQPYVHSHGSIVVLARDGDTPVGASTALPMAEAPAEMRQPFVAAGEDIRSLYYFGESVVLPSYRGQGLGRSFFAAREERARSLGYAECVFCAVERPEGHPLQPKGHRGNAEFWAHRGYVRDPRRACVFRWTDQGEAEDSPKTLVYWRRKLPPAAP